MTFLGVGDSVRELGRDQFSLACHSKTAGFALGHWPRDMPQRDAQVWSAATDSRHKIRFCPGGIVPKVGRVSTVLKRTVLPRVYLPDETKRDSAVCGDLVGMLGGAAPA